MEAFIFLLIVLNLSPSEEAQPDCSFVICDNYQNLIFFFVSKQAVLMLIMNKMEEGISQRGKEKPNKKGK